MAYKHTRELALDKCSITIHPRVELKFKALAKAGRELSPAKAIELICEEAVKDVKLSLDDLDAIQAEMKENYARRMRNRIKVAAINKGIPAKQTEKKGR